MISLVASLLASGHGLLPAMLTVVVAGAQADRPQAEFEPLQAFKYIWIINSLKFDLGRAVDLPEVGPVRLDHHETANPSRGGDAKPRASRR